VKNFRVTDGDLDINKSNRVDMVQGRDKLVQDLSLWLLEPLGIGYTTPNFGALLNYVDLNNGRASSHFIGHVLDEQREAEIEAEVDRILNLYQQDQVQKVRRAQLEGRLYLYRTSEILDSIQEIASRTDQDRMIIRAAITSGAGQDITLYANVDTEETDVSAS
jgi:hypothetical protein